MMDPAASPAADQSLLQLPTYEDVLEASRILNGVANKTPIKTSRTLNSQLGKESNIQAFLKCENEQRIGAFKFRGAYNAIYHALEELNENGSKKRKLDDDENGEAAVASSDAPANRQTANSNDGKNLHVITFSSGNHAQAIALSAKLLGCKATIIMPNDAPALKVAATKGYGGNIIFYDRYKQDRNQIAQDLLEKEKKESGGDDSSAIIIPPYNHKHVIAGQGTVGKELFDEIPDLDYLFVCVGGGGLISGCCLAASKLATKTGGCTVIGVEPEAGNDAQRSLETGSIVKIDTPATIADGAQTQALGHLTFGIMKQHVDQIITVSDDELINEMKFTGERMKMIVEPTGCLGIAGLRKMVSEGKIPVGSKCGVIVSGGNVDLKRYTELVSTTK